MRSNASARFRVTLALLLVQPVGAFGQPAATIWFEQIARGGEVLTRFSLACPDRSCGGEGSLQIADGSEISVEVAALLQGGQALIRLEGEGLSIGVFGMVRVPVGQDGLGMSEFDLDRGVPPASLFDAVWRRGIPAGIRLRAIVAAPG